MNQLIYNIIIYKVLKIIGKNIFPKMFPNKNNTNKAIETITKNLCLYNILFQFLNTLIDLSTILYNI